MKIVGFLLLSLLLISCNGGKGGGAGGGTKPPTEAELIKSIKTDAKLELPPGAKLLEYQDGKQVVDPSWAAKFSIPASEVKSLQAKVTALGDTLKSSGGITPTLAWWKPGTILAKAAYSPDGGRLYVKVILSEEGPGTYLYLEHAL
jgi:hypothetical protein